MEAEKKPGGPAVEGVTRSVSVNMRVTPALAQRIDGVRGEMTRSEWVRLTITKELDDGYDRG